MSVNLNKFVTNNLPEFLLLALRPSDVFSMDVVVKSLHSVIVCYDVQYFYKNYQVIVSRPVNVVSLEEFISYCESKVQSKFVVNHIDYQCCMTISDLIRMETWARLYDCVGPYLMKFLFFNCLLFVPLRENIYYCVHTPSQQAGRYEVVQSFRTKAGSRWITKKKQNNQNRDNCSKTKPVCFNIAGLLKDIKTICRGNADSMFREIMQTDGDDDDPCFDVLKSKLKIMANKDSLQTYKSIYKNTIGDSESNEIPLNRVKKFTNAVVCKVIPRELFGVNGNRDQYCENLYKVLNFGMFHDFTVQHIMHKIKVKKVKWLNRVSAEKRTEIMTKTLVWLTNVFVFGRIAHFFQMVTTNTPNNGIAYFAKNSWSKMCHEKISPLMSGGEFFKEIRPDTTEPFGSLSSSTTYRNWKICPYAKPNGVRLIFKLRRKEVSSAHKQLMDNCLTFLRCLLRTYPAEFRSVSKSQFFHDWRALQESRNGLQMSPVYYVRTDFRDAFTNFEQDKLQAVVRDRIKEYFGKKSQTLNIHSMDVVKIGGGDSVYCKKRTYVDGLSVPNFPVGSLLFFDKTTTVPLSRIWDAIRRCVQCNAVKRGSRLWAMTRGIVQGDRLSLALCDLLLADLQATHLNDMVTGPFDRLYRFVDDYVFVSTNQTAARHFLDAMCSGFGEYGLQLNLSKTETNLGGTDGLVKFLGFRLNAFTGEVTKDESAYRSRRPLHFFDYDLGRGTSGQALYAKMTGPNQHHVPAILVSKSFNSVATVARNLASIIAYKAYTFVAAVKQYLFHLNPAFLLKTVHAVARLMYAKICSLIRHSAVTPMQCKWIVYEVYTKMFRRHFPKNDGHRIIWTVDRIRDRQSAIGRKCNTRDLKMALRRYDFTKMFD